MGGRVASVSSATATLAEGETETPAAPNAWRLRAFIALVIVGGGAVIIAAALNMPLETMIGDNPGAFWLFTAAAFIGDLRPLLARPSFAPYFTPSFAFLAALMFTAPSYGAV